MAAHTGTIFFKILQRYSNFCKTQHVLYFLNSGGSRISNMTFQCAMKVMNHGYLCISAFLYISLHLFISLHFSAFLCNVQRFSTLHCVSMHFSAFFCISLHFSTYLCISLHFKFYILGQFDGAYRRPMDAFF